VSSPSPVVARSRAQLADTLGAAEAESAVVMTMGALHDGHLALIRAARQRVGTDGTVTVTIFINPLQFGAGEDLDRYPRSFDTDLDLCTAEGVDVVFAPGQDEMYPDGVPMVTIDPGTLATELEGKVVVSMANALTRGEGGFHALVPARGSVAAGVQAAVPGSLVSAAFHHLPAKTLGDLETRLDADVLVCADAPEATAATSELIERVPGLRALDAGGLHSAMPVEALTAVLLQLNVRYKAKAGVRITGVE